MGLPNLEEIKQRALELGLEGEEAKKWIIEEHRLAREEERERRRGRKKRNGKEGGGRKMKKGISGL